MLTIMAMLSNNTIKRLHTTTTYDTVMYIPKHMCARIAIITIWIVLKIIVGR